MLVIDCLGWHSKKSSEWLLKGMVLKEEKRCFQLDRTNNYYM